MVTYWWLKTKWQIFRRVRKVTATAVLVMSAFPTVCDPGSPRLLPDECSWNLMPSILTEIGLHIPIVGYDRPELRETLGEVLRWVMEFVFRKGRVCVFYEVRSKHLVYCDKSTGKATSRLLRDKHRKNNISTFTRKNERQFGAREDGETVDGLNMTRLERSKSKYWLHLACIESTDYRNNRENWHTWIVRERSREKCQAVPKFANLFLQ